MKEFIIGIAIFLVSMMFTIFQQDYNMHQRHLFKLKFVAEEAAAGAAQLYSTESFSEGKIVFNQTEGIKALEYILKENLTLNESLIPYSNSYWQDEVIYRIEFFDDSNTIFPMLYEHQDTLFTEVLTDPSIIVTVNTGQPRYRLIENISSSIRVANHQWKER